MKFSVNSLAADAVIAREVLAVREQHYTGVAAAEWEKLIAQSLFVAGARNEAGELIGVGFLVGNARHGTICDISVLPSVRKNGVGSAIVARLIHESVSLNIKFLQLTYDPSKPRLKDFYENHGFKVIDFCMWHAASLEALS